MEASLNIVESLEQDDLQSKTATTSADQKTGQIQINTKKDTCKKINENKKSFEKKLTQTIKEGETKKFSGKNM
jgi:hypothetical protein